MRTNYQIKLLAGTLVFFSFIFLGAGTFSYFQGWLYVVIGLVMMLIGNTVLKIDRELNDERANAQEGAKAWDKKILLVSFFATLGMYVVAGLDSGRYHWSPVFPPLLIALGATLTAAGQLIFLIAQKQNKFFSSTVRVQTDRNHRVCDTGLYRVVRHPGYMGSFIQTLGFPLIFGSFWSIFPVLISMVLLIIRTDWEDKTLQSELDGYKAYCTKTKYRLIPMLW